MPRFICILPWLWPTGHFIQYHVSEMDTLTVKYLLSLVQNKIFKNKKTFSMIKISLFIQFRIINSKWLILQMPRTNCDLKRLTYHCNITKQRVHWKRFILKKCNNHFLQIVFKKDKITDRMNKKIQCIFHDCLIIISENS